MSWLVFFGLVALLVIVLASIDLSHYYFGTLRGRRQLCRWFGHRRYIASVDLDDDHLADFGIHGIAGLVICGRCDSMVLS